MIAEKQVEEKNSSPVDEPKLKRSVQKIHDANRHGSSFQEHQMT